MTGVRLPLDMIAALDKAAKDQGVSRSEIIRDVVAGWLREHGYLPKGAA